MSKKIVVQKFGGTSVGSPEKIKAVANRTSQLLENNNKLVIVVSAMGNTTNQLVKLSKEITSNPSPREYDALVSTGENVSASLLAMSFQSLGIDAISLTGAQAGILTQDLHAKAKILTIKTDRIKKELDDNKVVIITGFQGINPNADVTTIGRGGSDTSAVALAAALDCEECEIYTDVDGVYTTDPRKIKDAKKLKEVSYEEMLEMASLGAKVLHPRAVECAKENKIILHVRSSFELTEGTRVKEVNQLEVSKPVTGITINENEAIISMIRVPNSPGIAGDIFKELAENSINVDMIIQNVLEKTDSNNISFSIHEDDLDQTLTITKSIAKKLNCKILSDTSIAKISCVGIGMISKPGTAAKMFTALGRKNINILRITTSEIKISCAIQQKDAQKALEVLHKEFELE
ncbi:aspartate kinase [bacterium]|nr:aspartate kinase [bacterium]|tara:strand:- start:253 stop:1470 length:1218 start_codon:yes stop_codon:yes gene_type:complete